MTWAFLYYVQMETLYPGANAVWSSLFILAVYPIAGIYVFMSLSMPRSGGEYIYISRILNPALGFMASWILTIMGINWSGLLTQWWVNWGIGQTLRTQGMVWHNQTMIDWGNYLGATSADSRWVIWIIGTIGLIAAFYTLSRGSKFVIKVMWVTFVAMLVMLVAFIFVALTAGPDRTIAGMQAMEGVKWSDIQAKVNEISGGAGLPAYAVLATVYGGMVWPMLNSLGTTYAANLSGEIKKVNVAQPFAQFATLFVFTIWWVVFVLVANAGIGENLIRSLAYIESQGQATATFGTFPLISYMVVWATDNWFLVALAGPFMFMIATWGAGIVGLSFAPSRNLFAFAFDGILPSWVNKVARNGSPTNAVILAGAIAWCVFTISVFTTWMSYITYTVTVWMVGWLILGVAAVAFPFVRRDIYEKSPAVVQMKLAGIPVISILGVLGFIVAGTSLFSTFLIGETPVLNIQTLIYTSVPLIVLPIVIYFVAYAWQKARGVPMDMRFRTIPPD
jgi:amino acid transporter